MKTKIQSVIVKSFPCVGFGNVNNNSVSISNNTSRPVFFRSLIKFDYEHGIQRSNDNDD